MATTNRQLFGRTSLTDRQHWLYRLFASADDLLYVGISYAPLGRFDAHKRTSAWWPLVDERLTTLERFPDRQTAERAERVAIEAEQPRFNIAWRDGKPPKSNGPREARSGPKSEPHNLHLSARLWKAFGEAVGERRRSAWATDFIDSVTRDPQLWKEFRALAKVRGEDWPAALLKAIGKYNADR